MAVKAELIARLTATQTGAADFSPQRFSPTVEKVLSFTSGTLAGQADILFTDRRTLAASANEDLDLAGALADAFGATINAAKVVAILVVAAAANTNNVVIGDATQPIPLFGGTNPTFAVKPGGFFFVAAPALAGLLSVGAGSTDDLKVTNSSSGSSVTYDIAILARSA